jgi:hypothetical protein
MSDLSMVEKTYNVTYLLCQKVHVFLQDSAAGTLTSLLLAQLKSKIVEHAKRILI